MSLVDDVPDTLQLATTPVCRVYQAAAAAEHNYAQLAEDLQTTEAATTLAGLEGPATVLLSPETALVRGRYRLTTEALSQICSLLSPGLSQTIFSLSGMRRTGREKTYDAKLAIGFFNDAVRLRFAQIKDHRLVINRATQHIEGLVGPRYRYFSNHELLVKVEDFVASRSGPRSRFTEAILQGRRLVLRYRSDDPAFEIPTERKLHEPFFGGYQFENSVTGDCSVRGANVVIRQWCDNKAVAPVLLRNRVPHVRTDKFNKNFVKLLHTLADKSREITELKPRVLQLLSTSLGLGGDPVRHATRVDALTTRLCVAGLRKPLAVRTVTTACMYGSYRHSSVQQLSPAVPLLECYAMRTYYDLFNALTHEAKKEAVDQRVHAEQLGYGLLMGTFRLC